MLSPEKLCLSLLILLSGCGRAIPLVRGGCETDYWSPWEKACRREAEALGLSHRFQYDHAFAGGNRVTDSEALWLSENGTYRWYFLTCYQDPYVVYGTARLTGDKLSLEPYWTSSERALQRSPKALYRRSLEGRTILLGEAERAAFDLLPSLYLGFAEIHPSEEREGFQAALEGSLGRAARAQKCLGEAYPPEELHAILRYPGVQDEERLQVSVDLYGACVRGSNPGHGPGLVYCYPSQRGLTAWVELFRLWRELQQPFDCPAPGASLGRLELSWEGGSRSVELPSILPEELEQACDPGLRLTGWLMRQR
jgi:hypothetical protein